MLISDNKKNSTQFIQKAALNVTSYVKKAHCNFLLRKFSVSFSPLFNYPKSFLLSSVLKYKGKSTDK